MSTDKTRGAFEAYFRQHFTNTTPWEIWQASRNAALAEAAGVCRVRADDTSYHRMVRAASGTCANLIEELRNE